MSVGCGTSTGRAWRRALARRSQGEPGSSPASATAQRTGALRSPHHGDFVDGGKDAAHHRSFEQLALPLGTGMLRASRFSWILSQREGRNGQLSRGSPKERAGRIYPTLELYASLQKHRAANAGERPGHAPSGPSASGAEAGLGDGDPDPCDSTIDISRA